MIPASELQAMKERVERATPGPLRSKGMADLSTLKASVQGE